MFETQNMKCPSNQNTCQFLELDTSKKKYVGLAKIRIQIKTDKYMNSEMSNQKWLSSKLAKPGVMLDTTSFSKSETVFSN